MNKLIPKIGAAIVTLTVFLFAIFMIVDFPFGSHNAMVQYKGIHRQTFLNAYILLTQ